MPDLVPAQVATGGSPPSGPGTENRKVMQLAWPQLQELVSRIAGQASRDGAPQCLPSASRTGYGCETSARWK
jgi:hypothetical protein